MKKLILFTLLLHFTVSLSAQLGPEINSWIVNTDGSTGYSNIPSNIQEVQYSDYNVYISASCIPGYDIGPWQSNPNIPANQNFVYKITRNPVENTGTPTEVGMGHIGVWTNGVSIFNVSDGMSYNSQGIWNRNAYYWEGISFDDCLGHPAPNGEYHHHVSPTCLYDEQNTADHAPIIGYAFDGYPVYGGYGYTNTDGTGGIKMMESSYVLSSANTRVNGPDVDASYPNGCFMEDYIYTPGAGDLDERNGRFGITPEYPAGTYAYFATISAPGIPTFPYTFYQNYFGEVQAGNTGPGSGHNTISETTEIYNPSTVGIELLNESNFKLYPNPTCDVVNFSFDSENQVEFYAELRNALGELVWKKNVIESSGKHQIQTNDLKAGVYHLSLTSEFSSLNRKLLIVK